MHACAAGRGGEREERRHGDRGGGGGHRGTQGLTLCAQEIKGKNEVWPWQYSSNMRGNLNTQ